MNVLKKTFKIIIVIIILIVFYKIFRQLNIDTEYVGGAKYDRYRFNTYLMEDGKVLVYGGYDWGANGKVSVNEVEIYDPATREISVTDNKALENIRLEREIYGITYNLGEIPVRSSSNLYIIKEPDVYLEKFKENAMVTDIYDIKSKQKLGRFLLPRVNINYLVFGFDDHLLLISGSAKSLKKGGYGSVKLYLLDFDYSNKKGSIDSKYEPINAYMHKNRYSEFIGLKLRNGKVLIYGGKDGYASYAKDGELFDPKTAKYKFIRGREKISDIGSMIELKDGSVLIVGVGRGQSEIIPARKLK